MKKQTKLGIVLAAAAVVALSAASIVSAKGWVQRGSDWYYVDNSGEAVTEQIQSSGSSKFYLGEDGTMQTNYFLEDFSGTGGNGTYYFGSNGAMVTNTWVAIESSRVDNQGDYVPDNYWYYFQASGKAIKGSAGNYKRTTIDGKKYAFNEYGQMLTGWIDNNGQTINPDDDDNPFTNALFYAGGDNDGALRSGWVTYYDGYVDGEDWQNDKTNLYFYFNPSNNKKVPEPGSSSGKTKKINGKTYAFNDDGMMISGWDAYDYVNIPSLNGKTTYFSGEDDGHQVKKGWVYTVPAEGIDSKAYEDDEEKYMYFNNSGDAVKDQFKKINGKFYCFNAAGIMKTGIVLWCPNGWGTDYTKFVDTLDLDYAEGSDVQKKGKLVYDDTSSDFIMVTPDGQILSTPAAKHTGKIGSYIKLHNFGSDGARKTGSNSVEFSDDTYVLYTNASGDKGSGLINKKYYSLGVLLKANSDIRYGIYNTATGSTMVNNGSVATPVWAVKENLAGPFKAQEEYFYDNLLAGNYIVLTTSGQKQKGSKTAKKDADGNYWYLSTDGTLMGIFTVNCKRWTPTSNWATKYVRNDGFVTFGKTADGKDITVVKDVKYSDANAQGLFDLLFDVNTAEGAILANVAGLSENDGGIQWNAEKDGNSVRLVAQNLTETCDAFQTDYDGKSNKWVPFGALDDSRRTVSLDYVDAVSNEDRAALGYVVTPNNDYFLNCYWVD